MPALENNYWLIGLAIIIIIIIFLLYKLKTKNNVSSDISNMASSMIISLGNKSNIKSVDGSISKVTTEIVNAEIVDVNAIKTLGASGVVETNRGFTFIFGSISSQLAEEINKQIK